MLSFGGFINQYTNWYVLNLTAKEGGSKNIEPEFMEHRRWTFYMLLCWAAAMLLLVYFFVPETYHPMYVYAKLGLLKDGLTDSYRLLRRKAQQLRMQTANLGLLASSENNSFPLQSVILRSIYRPGILLALEPMCLCLCIYSALLLGILYLFFGAFQVVFQTVYGFELWQRGLSFLGLLIGMVFAVLSDPYWRWNYCRLEREHQTLSGDDSGFFPEWRLPPGISLSFFFFHLPLANSTTLIGSDSRGAFSHYRPFCICLDNLS